MFNEKKYKIVTSRVTDKELEIKDKEPEYNEEYEQTIKAEVTDNCKAESNNITTLRTIIKQYKSLTVLGKIVYGLPFMQDIITTLYNIYKYE